jgi:hypothetical protein
VGQKYLIDFLIWMGSFGSDFLLDIVDFVNLRDDLLLLSEVSLELLATFEVLLHLGQDFSFKIVKTVGMIPGV